jgi:transcriptional regulator with XRE-family HTH domain
MSDKTENVTQFLPNFQEPVHFHQRLRMMRTARGMTQGQLAMDGEMDTGQVAHFEKGTRLPSFKNLRALAIALRCTSDYLLGLSDGLYEDGYRRGAFDAVEAMKAATMHLRRGLREETEGAA